MTRIRMFSTMVLASALLAGSVALAAPAKSIALRAPVNAMFGKSHSISFKLRNDSAQRVKVMAGDQEMVLEPGKAMPVKLGAGEKVILSEATALTPAGSVLTTSSPILSGATVAFK